MERLEAAIVSPAVGAKPFRPGLLLSRSRDLCVQPRLFVNLHIASSSPPWALDYPRRASSPTTESDMAISANSGSPSSAPKTDENDHLTIFPRG